MPGDELRSTRPFERYNIARNYVKFYNNFAVSASYLIPRSLFHNTSQKSFQSLIYAVLRKVVHVHPALGICIADEDSNEPKWRKLERIDLAEIVEFINAGSDDVVADGWLQSAHRKPLEHNNELPLWRIIVSSNFDGEGGPSKSDDSSDIEFGVGFFLHHAIGDGMSGGAFHVAFLSALDDIISKDGSLLFQDSMISTSSLPLLPALEQATPLPLTTWFVLKQVFTAFIYSPTDPRHWTGPPVLESTPKPPIGHIHSFNIPPSLSAKLLTICRHEKVTITALVTVLVARRLAKMYPTHSRFSGAVPFSLRKFTPISNREIVVYTSSLTPNFSSEIPVPRGYISCRSSSPTKPDPALWDSARECKAFIVNGTKSTVNQPVGMIPYVNDFHSFFRGQVGHKRAKAFEVTNIGVVDGHGGIKGKARFERIQFSTGLGTLAEPYCFCLATAKGGDMNVSLGWEDGVVGDDEAVGLAGWLEKSLRELADEAV